MPDKIEIKPKKAIDSILSGAHDSEPEESENFGENIEEFLPYRQNEYFVLLCEYGAGIGYRNQ